LNNPKANEEAFAGGWFHTGDDAGCPPLLQLWACVDGIWRHDIGSTGHVCCFFDWHDSWVLLLGKVKSCVLGVPTSCFPMESYLVGLMPLWVWPSLCPPCLLSGRWPGLAEPGRLPDADGAPEGVDQSRRREDLPTGGEPPSWRLLVCDGLFGCRVQLQACCGDKTSPLATTWSDQESSLPA